MEDQDLEVLARLVVYSRDAAPTSKNLAIGYLEARARLEVQRAERDKMLAEAERKANLFANSFDTLAEKWKEEEASRGKIVKVCPRCNSMREKSLMLLITEVPGDKWHCRSCGHDFAEPVYYQRVNGPS